MVIVAAFGATAAAQTADRSAWADAERCQEKIDRIARFGGGRAAAGGG